MDAVLEIRGMSKAFGGLQAVHKFDLQVQEKDLIGIIGPNGAGKTTVFNLITGFIRPDSGEVWLKGEKITRLKPFQIVNRGLCRTFQLVDLFKEMTALENVMIPCFSHRASQQRSKEEKSWKVAMKFLEEVGLENRFNEQAKNLAFGELRLLDIARAMATRPDVLLLDEPFSGLDAEDAEVLSSAIRQMHQKGQTMIIIEHRLRDLLKLVERVVAIVFGEKIAEGTPQEIMRNPKVVNAYLGERRE
ncbi:MAG: ABC transporter ATP-binding protein [Deltaproteobacteria bacterium]|nr:ABC transporter ATP-binding protein [Deltaproteobacteria bacterium]